VVTRQTVSSRSTQSPGRFDHSTIVPSATETPICGITISIVSAAPGSCEGAPPGATRLSLEEAAWCWSVGEELMHGLLHVLELWQDGLLERRAERDRNIRRGQSANRRVQ